MIQQGKLALNCKLRKGKETWTVAVLVDSKTSEAK